MPLEREIRFYLIMRGFYLGVPIASSSVSNRAEARKVTFCFIDSFDRMVPCSSATYTRYSKVPFSSGSCELAVAPKRTPFFPKYEIF
jgi:hypothetical protein